MILADFKGPDGYKRTFCLKYKTRTLRFDVTEWEDDVTLRFLDADDHHIPCPDWVEVYGDGNRLDDAKHGISLSMYTDYVTTSKSCIARRW